MPFDLQYNEQDLEEGEIPMSVPIQQRKELQANFQVQLLVCRQIDIV